MSLLSWDVVRMNMCRELARRSTCWKRQTAAIITFENKIISEGYNGVLSGEPHCCDVGPRDRDAHRVWSAENEVHGEINAILSAATQSGIPRGSTMYTLLSPCISCAMAICSVGIKRVVYCEIYISSCGIKILESHGVIVEKIQLE